MECEREIPIGVSRKLWLIDGESLGTLEGGDCGFWLTEEQKTHAEMKMPDNALRMPRHDVLQAPCRLGEVILFVRLEGVRKVGLSQPPNRATRDPSPD